LKYLTQFHLKSENEVATWLKVTTNNASSEKKHRLDAKSAFKKSGIV